mgnify:CR=1 FL=1
MTSVQSSNSNFPENDFTLLEDSEDADNHNSASTATRLSLQFQLDETYLGQRIDQVAATIWSDFSREKLKQWLKEGHLLVNGNSVKPKYKCEGFELLTLEVELEAQTRSLPEDIPLDIVYEDEHILVLNKPADLVVHPAAGHPDGTLLNALLFHVPGLIDVPRAGIVHRLDKDTTGLMVVAKTLEAHTSLVDQLQARSVGRTDEAIVIGVSTSGATIDAPIGRHRNQRTKMTVMTAGREAVTHLLNVTPLNDNYCLLDVGLETGRTHQIRVHLSHITYPIVGDRVYGGRRQLRAGLTEAQRQAINNFPRQALHAYTLGFVHPTTGEDIEVTTPIPEDMQQLMAVLSEGYDEE